MLKSADTVYDKKGGYLVYTQIWYKNKTFTVHTDFDKNDTGNFIEI